MPPRKGIVKSGNAGNSSKATKASSEPEVPKEKPLFPTGFKYPLSLLNEKCQKLGWEKPHVDSYTQQGGGFTFAVTLSRINKKTNEKETVRLRPMTPYTRPTAIEARHWGATYALYRCFNDVQLHLVLPPGPKDYWKELATEHKSSPEKDKWLYAADPFTAQAERDKEKERRQAARSALPTSDPPNRSLGNVFNDFSNAPEVRISASLRDRIEAAVKKGFELFPEANDKEAAILPESDKSTISEQLITLGFKPPQVRKAIEYFSNPSTFASRLLATSSPVDACIEYLILNVPECDLPQRFLPTINSSNPFITSVHSGADDLKRRWIEEKASKEAGWPSHTVKEMATDSLLLNDWDMLIFALGQRLIGEDWHDVRAQSSGNIPFSIDLDEAEALGVIISGKSHLILPLFTAPVEVHVFTSVEHQYPRPGFCPVYLTSKSIPAYVRLHLTSRLLLLTRDNLLEEGESFLMAVMRVIEAEWALVEDNGPPEISEVLRYLMPQPPALHMQDSDVLNEDIPVEHARPRHISKRRKPVFSDEQISEAFKALQQSDKYAEMLRVRKRLPAFQSRDEFVRLLDQRRVVVVVGETGSGKTTQLPQFVLDSMIESGNGSKASILVTQPRRISAISVASRVSAERADDGSIGYAIRGENKQTPNTKVLFCTTGVVLRRLSLGDKLTDVSHVIVDEVHERSMDGDILLLELKELLKTNSQLKIILMSATINHELFTGYFDNAPLLTIPGFTHPVNDRYLEDYISIINYDAPGSNRPRIQDADKRMAFRDRYIKLGLDEKEVSVLESVVHSDRIDFQLIAAVVEHIVSSNQNSAGILIFLPGAQEIRQCVEAIKSCLCKENHYDIFPLHANLSSDEQRLVFKKTKGWKIVAATNVAETSITIDDVVYVIDAGKVKENRYDPETSISRLVETWITAAAARQRRGRAGRTQPGTCYKLYTRKQANDMKKHPVPEILRVPLQSVLLSVKAAKEEEDPKAYLGKALDAPALGAIDAAWKTLIDLGAIDNSGRLTPLGRHMAILPIDLRLGKMLILSAVFCCLNPILSMTAILSSKPLFSGPMEKREEAARARARFATDSSDLLTDLKAFDECTRLRSEGKPQSHIRLFCEENFISITSLRDINMLRNELFGSMVDLGFVPFNTTPTSLPLNRNSGNVNLIKAVILGGVWPQVANIRLPSSAIKFDKIQSGTVQRENVAKDYKIFDIKEGRVFLHPSSTLFSQNSWKSPFLVYFHKYQSSKVFLRDATEVPLFALLLFGGTVTIDKVKGGLTIVGEGYKIRLKAWPRIGVLVNHLRRLLDAQLEKSVEDGTMFSAGQDSPVLGAMLALLERDGLTE